MNVLEQAMELCSVPGCTRRSKCRGWCGAHHERWRMHGDVQADRPVGKLPRSACLACGSEVRRSTNQYCSQRCSSLHRDAAATLRSLEVHPRSVPVGTERMRVHSKTGDTRVWVKVAEPHTWRPRAVAVWEATHGPLPRGMIVHHKNRDGLHDQIDNLEAMTRAEHLEEHRQELTEAKR